MPALVVLDTNALILPFERRIRIEAELERLLGPFQGLVPSPCILELERIAREETGARRDRAKMAIVLAARFERVESEGRPDAAALQVARERGAHLFTNDAALIRLARAERVPVVRLKGLSHLMLTDSDL
jgi:uncharacterized protein